MNSILEFVQSLQEMKKSQQKWASLSIHEKSQILKHCADNLQSHAHSWAEQLAAHEHLPLSFVQSEVLEASCRIIKNLCQSTEAGQTYPKPTGIVSIHLPELFSFRVLCERLMPALMAGNGVYVYSLPGNVLAASLWRQLLPEHAPVRFFEGDAEFEQMMAAHPGVHGVSFAGSLERADRLRQILAPSFKKAQVSSGYHNSALILGEADLSEVARKLCQSCCIGMGRLPWNISTIYVLESQMADFQKEFFNALSSTRFEPVPASVRSRTDQLISQLKADKGKVLFGGGEGQPFVVEDLSHCSVLQQECLEAPVIFLSSVKYAHEMVKWTNTSPFGMYAQIFGPDEKVEKFGRQLEVSGISGNGWIETMDRLPIGIKQSLWGHPSLLAFGDFFSDCRKIDGLKSKN